jgi:hypothetical protein
MVSTNATRARAITLVNGRKLSGKVFIYVRTNRTLKDVRFYLDDPKMAKARATRTAAPYDMAGGTKTKANAWDTARVGKGAHTLVALVRTTDGRTVKLSARFYR